MATDWIHNAAADAASFVESRMEEVLLTLFQEIDTDGNGVISQAEFVHMPVSSAEAFRRLVLEGMEARAADLMQSLFPPVKPEAGFVGTFLWRYLILVVLFQFFLYFLEHWRALMGLRFVSSIRTNADEELGEDQTKLKRVGKDMAFYYDTPLTSYEIAKMVFFGLSGIAVVRFLFTIISCFLGIFCLCVAVWQPHETLWFRIWFQLGTLCARSMMFWMCYFRIDQDGRFDKSAKILVSNHPCIWEVVMLFFKSGGCSFVSSVNNLAFPGFPQVVNAARAVIVSKDPEAKKNTLLEIKRRTNDPNASQLMIFPEGTTGNNIAMLKFKKGAFTPGAPVQPVCFRFPYYHYNPCWTGAACGGNNMDMLFFRTCCQFANRMQIKVLKVYHPSEQEKEDPELYAENVRKKMALHLDMPISEAAQEDYVTHERLYRDELYKQRREGKGKQDACAASPRTDSKETGSELEQLADQKDSSCDGNKKNNFAAGAENAVLASSSGNKDAASSAEKKCAKQAGSDVNTKDGAMLLAEDSAEGSGSLGAKTSPQRQARKRKQKRKEGESGHLGGPKREVSSSNVSTADGQEESDGPDSEEFSPPSSAGVGSSRGRESTSEGATSSSSPSRKGTQPRSSRTSPPAPRKSEEVHYFSTWVAADNRRKKLQKAISKIMPKQFVVGPDSVADSLHPEGIVEDNWSDPEGGYVTPAGIRNLMHFKYAAGKYSALDNVLNPFWFWFSSFLPASVSPNLVTFAGFLVMLSGFVVMLVVHVTSETISPEARWAGHIYSAVAILVYQTCDAADGKHARRTGQSTPLGALFDHGCDAVVVCLNGLICVLCAHEPFMPENYSDRSFCGWLNFLLVPYAMFAAQWEHYHTGILPAEGCTEAQFLSAVCMVVTGWPLFREWMKTPAIGIDSLYCKDLILWIGIVFALVVIGGSAVRVYRQWRKGEMETTSNTGNGGTATSGEHHHHQQHHQNGINPLGNPVWTMLPLYQHFVIAVIFFRSEQYSRTPVLMLMILGLAAVDLTLRMIVSGICKIRYPLVHLTLLPMVCYSCFLLLPQEYTELLDFSRGAAWRLFSTGPDAVSSASGASPKRVGVAATSGTTSSTACLFGGATSSLAYLCNHWRLVLLLMWEIAAVLWVSADTISRICGYLRIPFLAPLKEPWSPKVRESRKSSALPATKKTN
ncbi:unnamed protein product [Amoebophrya sp. A120]|nr:unnamed protein product [Amoebophrya sp. A120]|eukprot:GSA120T00002390001.1